MAHGRIVEMLLADICGIFLPFNEDKHKFIFLFLFFQKAPMIM